MLKDFKLIHTESSCGWGGQEIRIISEALEFKKVNLNVEIWANPVSKILRESEKLGIKVKPVDLRRKRLWTLYKLIKAIRCEPKSIIFGCHSSTDHWLVALARLLSRKTFQIIRYRHISTPLSSNFTSKWLYRSGCDLIITTSEEIAKNILQLYTREPSKVINIPTGVDINFFRRSKTSREAKMFINIPAETFVLGTVSTLRSWKGHEILLVAFSKLPTLERYKLLIVGGGPFQKSIERKIASLNLKDYVQLVGHKEDVRPYLEALDLFLFPSYANEGVPQAVLQAMCYRLPVVASDLLGVKEALEGYESARFFQSGNPDSLRNSLGSMLEPTQKRSSIDTLESILQRISIDYMTARVKAAYESLAR